MRKITVGIIGAGNMGTAFYNGIKKSYPSMSLYVFDTNQKKLDHFLKKEQTSSIPSLIEKSSYVIIAVKPQLFDEVAKAIPKDTLDTVFISIMAGVSLKTLKKSLKTSKVVRSMPNLAISIQEGLTGWLATKSVSSKEKKEVSEILSSLGTEIEVKDEEGIDKITALSGSGPAYFFHLTECIQKQAEKWGFTTKEAQKMAVQTLSGSAHILKESKETPGVWKDRVTSKGGTTEAALKYLIKKKWDTIFKDALKEAYNHSKKLKDARFCRDAELCRDARFCVSTQFSKVKQASKALATLSNDAKNTLLSELASYVVEKEKSILDANKKDLSKMDKDDPSYDRLLLTSERIAGIAGDIKNVIALDSPLHLTLDSYTHPNGLKINKISVPFGVIGVIYEARPNVTLDVFALCFKSGNACILKGGEEAHESNKAITALIHDILLKNDINTDSILLLPPDKESVKPLLEAEGEVDLIIPRGGQGLIQFVRENAKVPVIETGAGIVHTYFDKEGDVEKGRNIIENAKCRRPSVCNALDTLIIHTDRLDDLYFLIEPLEDHSVEIYADEQSFEVLAKKYNPSLLKKTKPEDFGTEFLSLKMSIKTVHSIDEALTHIETHTSKHSEAIITENKETSQLFLNSVDAAAVYSNASTAFTDGAQFGLGAEIGISTQKLHARGPMGLRELTTYKWVIEGNGQIRPA
ncbi:glutamate-5-semialdehyde dehydrogenase [Patescibacteria group bacterium]|nr:glutamate-5-semialdehyde dehydrogenase [Patescibacteria group bacterium]